MSKLKLKYEVEVQCQAFYTGKSVQVSKNGQELLCDDVTSITITDLNTGQASKINHSSTEDGSITGTFKSSIIKVDDEEETADDAFQDSRIKLEENDRLTTFQFSPNGSKLLIACSSLLLKLYSWPERKQLHQFRSYHRSPITCLAWDESSTLFISGSPDATARVWDTRRLCSTHCLRGGGGVFGCVSFHPNLHKYPLVYAGVANVLCVWKLSAGTSELVHRFEDAHYMNITNLVHIPDGKLVTCGLDCAAVLWDATTMTRLRVYMLEEAVAGAVLLPSRVNDLEGTIRLAVAGETGRLCVHRMDTGVLEYSSNALVLPAKGGTMAVTGVTICPALESVVLTTYDHNIIFVHLADLQHEGNSELVPLKMLCGNNDQIFATIFVMFNLPSKKSKSSAEEEDDLEKSESSSATSNELLVVASNSPDLRVYQTCDLSVRVVRGHTEAVLALARHPALEDVFASSSRDRSVRVWRATAGGGAVCVAVAEGHSHVVATVFLGMDILVSGSEDTSFKRWALTEEKLTIIKGEKSIAAAAPQPLLCTCTQVGHDKDINSVCVAPRDRLVATGSGDKTVKVWSGRDLSLLGTLRGHKRGVWDVRFSPVDKLLASASADCTVKIWLLESYTLATTLESHASGVLTVSWLNSGLQLLTSCSSGLLKLWEAKTGVCLQTFAGHEEGRLWAVDTRKDGARVVTAGEDARVVVWRDATKEVQERVALQRQQHQSEQQTLSNLLLAERWQEALLLTLRLDQPYNSLKVIKGILRTGGVPALARVTSTLEQHQLGTLVKFAVSWNTRTATCYYAQRILNLLLETKLPEELEPLPFWEHLLEAAVSYSERHYTRAAALHQATGILEYCLGAVQLRHAGQDVLGSSLEEEDSRCEEIDDITLLNQLQPQRPDENSIKSESEASESSEEEEYIHDDEKKSNKSASDSDHSDAADIEPIVKSKKKLKKMSVEDLEDGYVKERCDVTSAEKEDGDASMEDEGVESGLDDSEVEDHQNHQEYSDSDNEHERRIASLQRGSHSSRSREGRGNKDSDSRDYVRDSSVDDGQRRSMTPGRRGTRGYGGSYSRSPANRRGFGGPDRGVGGGSNRGQSGGYRDRGRSPDRGGRGMSFGRGGRGMSFGRGGRGISFGRGRRGMSFGRGGSGMSPGRGGRGMSFARGGRGMNPGRGGRGSFRSRGEFR